MLTQTSEYDFLSQSRNKFAFLMFGIGMLLPWNVMLAAMDFFEDAFPDYKPSFTLLVAVSVPLLLVQLLVYFFLQYMPLQFKLTCTFAINTVVTVLLVLIPIVVQNQAIAYYSVLGLSVLFGSSYAVLQACLYGVAGPCAALTNNLMLGIGLSGLLVNAIRMVFLAAIPQLNIEAQLFFYGSAAFLLFCTILSHKFCSEYLKDPFCQSIQKSHTVGERWTDTCQVYKVNWKEAWAVCVTYWVQFTFYPGVMLEYQFSFIPNFSWFVITVVTYASWADTLGRYLAGKFDWVPKSWLLPVCLLRGALFTTLYMLTYEGIDASLFGAQWWVIILLGLFALTCGYLSTLGMKYGSDAETINQGLAGTIMGIHLSLGISLGSTFAAVFLS